MRALAALPLLAACTSPVGPEWSARHTADSTELLCGERVVLRTVHDFAPERHDATFKVFTHLYGAHGEGPLTKGDSGGLYPHHRGVFVGWNRVRFCGRVWDFWHGKDGVAQQLERSEAGDAGACQTFALRWTLADGTLVLREVRTLLASRGGRGELVLDVRCELTSEEPVELGGDAHHAGCHVRAAQEVAEHERETELLLPSTARRLRADDESIQLQCPFAALLVTIAGRRYAIAHFDHPGNPGPSQCSVRRYGRLGAFTTASLEPRRPLLLRWRIVVADAQALPTVADLAALAPTR